MNIGTVLVVGVPIVVAVLTWMDFKLDGPRLIARLWARIQAPRREREELRRQVEELRRKTDDQATQIVELMQTTRQQGAALRDYAGWRKDWFDLINHYNDFAERTHDFAERTTQRLNSLESRTITSMPSSTSKRAKQTETTGGPVRGPLTWEQHLQAADAMARLERERADVKELATSLEQAFSEENRPILQYPVFQPGHEQEEE